MLIGEVSKKCKVPIETLRYYERIGLITPGRIKNNRFYKEEDIKKLEYIMKMKSLMFSLEQIKKIISIDEQIDQGLQDGNLIKEDVLEIRREVEVKFEEILAKERELNRVKDHLSSLMVKIEKLEKGDFYE